MFSEPAGFQETSTSGKTAGFPMPPSHSHIIHQPVALGTEEASLDVGQPGDKPSIAGAHRLYEQLMQATGSRAMSKTPFIQYNRKGGRCCSSLSTRSLRVTWSGGLPRRVAIALQSLCIHGRIHTRRMQVSNRVPGARSAQRLGVANKTSPSFRPFSIARIGEWLENLTAPSSSSPASSASICAFGDFGSSTGSLGRLCCSPTCRRPCRRRACLCRTGHAGGRTALEWICGMRDRALCRRRSRAQTMQTAQLARCWG